MFGYNTSVGMMQPPTPVGPVNTMALLHMDGANGGTTFTDETGLQTWTATGAVTSTAQFEFGTASLAAITNGHFIQSNSNLSFPGSFTIECWIYPTNTFSGSNAATFIWDTGETNILFGYGVLGASKLYCANGAFTNTITLAAPSTNTWHHFAWCFDGATHYVFFDGTLLTNSISGSFSAPASTTYQLGNVGVDGHYYQDEVRISNIARYTSNFTPSGPFVVD